MCIHCKNAENKIFIDFLNWDYLNLHGLAKHVLECFVRLLNKIFICDIFFVTIWAGHYKNNLLNQKNI